MTDRSILLTLVFLIIVNNCYVYGRPLTLMEQQVQLCINQDVNRQPVIIDTDTDIDDLWAIHYVLNVPTVDVLAITTVGNGYSKPFFSGSNVLTFLDLIGCSNGVGVGYGVNVPLLSSGYVIPSSLLNAIDSYMTGSTCLNQSANIFLQPSPFSAIELIKLSLKYSKVPVDILVLGTMTNIATAISEDRSIISKIGTLYFSDILALQRIGMSGIKNIVAMPLIAQNTLTVNLTQLNETLKKLNIQVKPFVLNFISSFAKCTNATEHNMKWWDNSAAQLMVQMQTNNSQGFCLRTQKVKSLYILSADSHQFYGQGMIDTGTYLPNVSGLANYTICTETNSDIFLSEFLNKISSEKLYSCQRQYYQRFDIKLQQ
ncbi:unnamed protein product, partial [Rotaria sp. Silwood2]